VFTRRVFETKIKGLLPNREDWKNSALPIARGSLIGFLMGVIPGPSNTISSFVSYAVEKRLSKHPERFGKGAIEGVAGPESANNSACAGNFIPVLTLGIPTSAVMAVIVGAFIIHGVTPGPLLIKNNPDIFWGTIASMYIGNIMLLILNLPLIGIWVRVLKVPYGILFPLILLFCFVGAYANNNSLTELNVMVFFGLVGYLMKKTGFEPAPLVMAYILCPFLEDSKSGHVVHPLEHIYRSKTAKKETAGKNQRRGLRLNPNPRLRRQK
jgi:putative tricarboxylic transport membrane protein